MKPTQGKLSINSSEEDVAMVKRALGRVTSPAILVGHSYGGSVITAAGTDDRVVGLVYIAAVAPDAGETTQGQLDKFPPTGVFSHIEVAEGRLWLKPDGPKYFAGNLSEEDQKLVWATHYAPAADLSPNRLQAPLGSRNRVGTSWPTTTKLSTQICNVSWQNVWEPAHIQSTVAMWRCSRILTSCSTSYVQQ
jgi:pimeloyl-ACP methyl ester carboxylesterase